MIMDEQNSQRASIVEVNLLNSRGSPPLNSIELPSSDENLMGDVGCCNVYVANLPPSVDATAIRRLFETVGKVLHVKLLLDIASGVSRGIAFVMFENVEVARKACAIKNKVVLDGNLLQVRQAERSLLHNSPSAHVRSSVVYIRNVPGNITHDVVKRFCEERFGPVVEVSPHPQSAELKGPSPFNMDFVVFKSVDDACRCVENVDGRVVFPMPSNHPFTMAKMITDVAGEMRKSILLRRRSSDNTTVKNSKANGTKFNASRRSSASQVPPPLIGSSLSVNPQFQPFVQSYSPSYQSMPLQNQPPLYQVHPSRSFQLTHPTQISAPHYDNVSNGYFDTSMSQRSSLDTSMFQSQRGSLIMLNAPHQSIHPAAFPAGPMLHEHQNAMSLRTPVPNVQCGQIIPPHPPVPAPQYYQHQIPFLMGQQSAPIALPVHQGQHASQQMIYYPMSGH